MSHEWKVGDVAYRVRENFAGQWEMQSTRVKAIRKDGLELEGRELAWGCRARVRPDEMAPSEREAWLAAAAEAEESAREHERMVAIRRENVVALRSKAESSR